MGRLKNFHKGWQNEKLAAYLLSRISFVAQPSSNGDDIGTDLFCTLFKKQDKEKAREELSPTASFAIQIKSNKDPINLSTSLQYLDLLRIPYFVGVAGLLRLDIYSVETLPYIFAWKGREYLDEPSVELRLVDDNMELNAENCLLDGKSLRCPRIATLKGVFSEPAFDCAANRLVEICERAQINIASRLAEEHVYQFPDGSTTALAGEGSARHYRKNLMLRLAEAFANVRWRCDVDMAGVAEEFKTLEEVAGSLEMAGYPVPDELKRNMGKARSRLCASESLGSGQVR